MKKKISIISCFFVLILILIPQIVNAATIDMELTASEKEIEVTKNKDTEVILKINLGNFTNIPDEIVLGYTATLKYDSSIFDDDITVTGKNGWNIEYNQLTGKMISDTASAKANTQIAEIKLKLRKDNLDKNQITTIRLADIVLSDGYFEINLEKEEKINIINRMYEAKNNETQEVTDFISTVPAQNTFNTLISTANKSQLPNAGTKKIIIVAIFILTILMVFFKFKSRKIKY